MTETLSHYLGAFYVAWSIYETNLEILCMRELGISPKKTHIVFSTLGFSPKFGIAISLLSENKENNELIKAIQKVPKIAKRNHIVHSVISRDEDFNFLTFTKREISRSFAAKKLHFNHAKMQYHFNEFMNAALNVEKLSNITHEERVAYNDVIKGVE